jgi:hypothetical protein
MHTQSLSLVDTATHVPVQHIDYASPEALFIGLAWSPDGAKTTSRWSIWPRAGSPG